jgi:hypothetical protein
MGREMRVLIQDLKSMLFLKEVDVWTKNSDDAMNFDTTVKALRYHRKHRLKGAQIVIKFEKDSYGLPLSDSRD